MSDIVNLNTKPNEHSGLKLFGVACCSKCANDKETWHKVILEGRVIPNLFVRKWKEKIELKLDGRFIYIFDDLRRARVAANMAANAMAIGQGYPWFGADSKKRPFAPTAIGIEKD